MTQHNTTAQEPSDTGGPAFPVTTANGRFIEGGMTLLDHFAGQACAADITQTGLEGSHAAFRAGMAYEQAAAMLAEKRRRERPPATAQGEV